MEPIRTCVLTKTKASKKKLIRLVKNDKGKFVIDERQIAVSYTHLRAHET